MQSVTHLKRLQGLSPSFAVRTPNPEVLDTILYSSPAHMANLCRCSIVHPFNASSAKSCYVVTDLRTRARKQATGLAQPHFGISSSQLHLGRPVTIQPIQRNARNCRSLAAAAKKSTGEVTLAVLQTVNMSASPENMLNFFAEFYCPATRHDEDQSAVCMQRLDNILSNCSGSDFGIVFTAWQYQQPGRRTVHAAGNICRSPAAGAVLKKVVERSGVADEFEIDSCGTGGSGHEDWYSVTASSSSTQVCICTFTRRSSLRHSVACFLYQAIFAISVQYHSLHAAQML